MTNGTSPKLLLNVAEAREALGGICEKTLWSNTRPRGTIPCVRIGSRVFYDPRDLALWIEHQKERGPVQ